MNNETRGSGERPRQDRVAFVTSRLRSIGIFDQASSEEEVNRKNQRIDEMFRDMGGGMTNPDRMKQILNSTTATDRQKDDARANLGLLAEGVVRLMETDEDLNRVVDIGLPSVIDATLPESLIGLGEEIRNTRYKTEEVRKFLDDQDELVDGYDLRDPVDNKAFFETAYESLNELRREKGINSEARVELKKLGPFYGEMAKDEESVRSESLGNNEVVEQLKKMERDRLEAERRAEQQAIEQAERQRDKGKRDFFEAVLLHESPQNVDPFSEMAPTWARQDNDKGLLQKIIALANVAYTKLRYGNQIIEELLDPKAGGTYAASNEVMRKMLSEIPGVNETLQHIIEQYAEPVVVDGQYLLRLKGQSNIEVLRKKIEAYKVDGIEPPSDLKKAHDEAEKDYKKWLVSQFGDIKGLQRNWIKKLPEMGINGVECESDALEATSIAWCFLFSGHFFESIDWSKDIPPCDVSVAQAWNMCHPLEKMRNKMLWKERTDESGATLGTEEGWGGNKGQWLVRRLELARQGSQKDKEFCRSFIRGEITPFPRRMLISFIEYTTVNVVGSDTEMSMAQALYEKRKIDWRRMPSSSDPWGSYYDFADSASKLYQITTGKMQAGLVPKDKVKTEELIGKMADARNKLRRNLFWRNNVDNPEFVLWALAGIVPNGLFKESSEMVLLTDDVQLGSQQRNLDYYLRLRELVAKKEDREWILNKLNSLGAFSEVKRKKIMNPITRDL